MFCNKCGKENRNDRKFCTNCGEPLRDYTKPRENLIMPQDIEREQQLVSKINKLAKIFNIIMAFVLLAAATLTVGTFFVPEKLRLVAGIASVSLFAIFLIVWFVKKVKINSLKKQLENTESKEEK